MRYDVTFLNLRPHVQPRALEAQCFGENRHAAR